MYSTGTVLNSLLYRRLRIRLKYQKPSLSHVRQKDRKYAVNVQYSVQYTVNVQYSVQYIVKIQYSVQYILNVQYSAQYI
jgi:hypothetical protein